MKEKERKKFVKELKEDRKKFVKELKEDRKKFTKLLNPRICYTSDYDIFSMVWGKRKVDSTIETNLLSQGDVRFDITKNGTIVGLEIENFKDILKKFDGDKRLSMKIKIRRWFIFTEFGVDAVPYILDLSNEDVSEDEIALCIQEQIYSSNASKESKDGN